MRWDGGPWSQKQLQGLQAAKPPKAEKAWHLRSGRFEGEEARQPGQAERAQLAREERLCSVDPLPQLRGAAGTPEEARGQSQATHSLCGPGCWDPRAGDRGGRSPLVPGEGRSARCCQPCSKLPRVFCKIVRSFAWAGDVSTKLMHETELTQERGLARGGLASVG